MSRSICVVASEILGMPGIGGPGTADSLLAVALGRAGHRVELLVAPGRALTPLSGEWESRYEQAGVGVRRLEPAQVRPSFLEPTFAVFEALRADPPEVVIADDWRALAYAPLRARQVGRELTDTAFVVYTHGPSRVLAEAARKVPDTLARFGEEVAQRACIELADVVVSPSEWLLSWMKSHGWPVAASAEVIQNPWYSVALGEPAPRPVEPARVQRLAFFGQLREGKGIGIFVDSLRTLDAELLEGLELLFLGRETPRWSAERVRAALGQDVARRVTSIRFETGLDRGEAIQELLRPGTLVVLPSLLENSPYAVVECLEHGIPFIAARVGGVAELIASDDATRVLVPPTVSDFAAALTDALSDRKGLQLARPARDPEQSLEQWVELIESIVPRRAPTPVPASSVTIVAIGPDSVGRARRLAQHTRAAKVEVVPAASRREGLEGAGSDWLLFLDEEAEPQEGMLEALLAAQSASGADVVTAGARFGDDPAGIHLFLGDPRGLGLVENQYGVVGLVRRACITGDLPLDDWALFAHLARSGAVIVSIPEALSVHRGRVGRAGDVPGAGLSVLEAFEDGSDDLPQLAATLAAASSHANHVPVARRGLIPRSLGLLRSEGLAGLAGRVRSRLVR